MHLRVWIWLIFEQLCHKFKLKLLCSKFLQIKQVKIIEIVHYIATTTILVITIVLIHSLSIILITLFPFSLFVHLWLPLMII